MLATKKHEGLTMLVDEGAVNEWDESLATVFDTMRKRRLILLTVCPQEKGPGPATFNCRNTLLKLVKRTGSWEACCWPRRAFWTSTSTTLRARGKHWKCCTGSLSMCLQHFVTIICGTIETHTYNLLQDVISNWGFPLWIAQRRARDVSCSRSTQHLSGMFTSGDAFLMPPVSLFSHVFTHGICQHHQQRQLINFST